MAWKTSVLVVANVTAASDDLIAALGERAEKGPAEFTLLLPASGGDSESAHREMERALDRMREAGLEAKGMVGDRDPVVAVVEAWDPRRYDEVLVSTLPSGTSRWLQIDLPHRIARFTGVPVTHVVADELARHAPTGEPPPAHERPGVLSPLTVLTWSRGSGSPRAAGR